MSFDFTKQDTGRGDAVNVGRNGQSATIFFRADLNDHAALGPIARSLAGAVIDTVTVLAARRPDLSETGFSKRAAEEAARIAPAFRATQQEAPKALKANAERRSKYDQPHFNEGSSHDQRAEQRAWLRSLSMSAQLTATQNDPALAAAMVEGGQAMSGLPADVFRSVHEGMRVHNAMRHLAGQRDYSAKASADDPLAMNVDHAAARKEAVDLLAGIDAETELLATVPTLLSNVIEAVAVAANLSRTDSFNLLSNPA